MREFLHELKELWDDPRGPGKLLIGGTVVVLMLFSYLLIVLVSGGC